MGQIEAFGHKTKDISGIKYGRLTPTELVGFQKNRYAIWKCKCDCGKEKNVLAKHLRNNCLLARTRSCGCLHKEQVIIVCKNRMLPYGESSRNSYITGYKKSALKRGLEYSLTLNQFEKLTKGNCYFCGKSPLNEFLAKNSHSPYKSNGIDRLDSKKGYTIDNCVSCCKWCNQAKSTMSVSEFKDWLTRVYKHTILKAWDK